jgi:uncharacterized damage-inducible protein DinB
MEWADARVWRAVPGLHDVPPNGPLHDTLFHTHLTQHAFLQLWTGQQLKFPDPKDFKALGDLLAWVRTYYRDVAPFLGQLDEAQLRSPLPVQWARHFTERTGREPGATTLAETLFQVTSHSTYHRGQANARLRALGVEPPLVDYIAWIWLGRPRPEWPDLSS